MNRDSKGSILIAEERKGSQPAAALSNESAAGFATEPSTAMADATAATDDAEAVPQTNCFEGCAKAATEKESTMNAAMMGINEMDNSAVKTPAEEPAAEPAGRSGVKACRTGRSSRPAARGKVNRSAKTARQMLPTPPVPLAGSTVAAKLFDGIEYFIRETGYRFGRNDEVTAVMLELHEAYCIARSKLGAIEPKAGEGEFIWQQCKLVADDAAITAMVAGARELLAMAGGRLTLAHGKEAAALAVHAEAIAAICDSVAVVKDARVSTIADVERPAGA